MATTEKQINAYAEQVNVDFTKAHKQGVSRLVRQAVTIAYHLSLLPGSTSPFAKRLLNSYERLVERIGYDPIPL